MGLAMMVSGALFIWIVYRVGVTVVEDSLEGREFGALASLGAFFVMLTLGVCAGAESALQIACLVSMSLFLTIAIWLARANWLAPSSLNADGWVFCALITSILMNPLVLGFGGQLGPFSAAIAMTSAAACFVVVRRTVLMMASHSSNA